MAEPAQAQPFKVVVDTDLGFASDDAMALFILLQSESVELLGVSVVTGNQWRDQEVANALRLLEIAGRTDVPVYPGAETPLVTNMEFKFYVRSGGCAFSHRTSACQTGRADVVGCRHRPRTFLRIHPFLE